MGRPPKYPKWDYSHLYRHIYLALSAMEPFIYGGSAYCTHNLKDKRRFQEARVLAGRLAEGVSHLGEDCIFDVSCKGIWVDAFRWHCIYLSLPRQRKSMIDSADNVIKHQHINRLTYLMSRYSTKWWD